MNHNQSLSQVLRTTGVVEVPLVLSIMSDIICISATEYGAVETSQVNESMNNQLIIKTLEEMNESPILLLNKTPRSSLRASLGKLRLL